MNNKDFEKIYEYQIGGLFQNGQVKWVDLANDLGYTSGEALRSQFKREKKKRGNPKTQNAPAVEKEQPEQREQTSYKESDNSIHIVCDSPRIRTKDDVIREFGIDTSIWEVKEFTIRTSEGYRKDRKVDWHVSTGMVTSGDVEDSGKILIVPMVHTETKFARKEFSISTDYIEKFFDNLKPEGVPAISRMRQYKDGSLVLEIDLADAHVGNESLPFEQLKERIVNLVYEITDRCRGMLFEKIYLVQLGDILHFDGFNRQTTGGTAIRYGTDFYTMFENAMNLMIWTINELSNISKIEVVNIYGNHDKINSYTLAKTLEAYFRTNENVKIDACPDSRKFRKIGVTSVAFVHGDMPKSNVYSTFQKEQRKLFGETLYSEIHLGHLHHDHSLEKDGVILRYLPSVTIPDEWHVDNGFTGAKQGTQCFVWDLEKGLSNIWMIPV